MKVAPDNNDDVSKGGKGHKKCGIVLIFEPCTEERIKVTVVKKSRRERERDK